MFVYLDTRYKIQGDEEDASHLEGLEEGGFLEKGVEEKRIWKRAWKRKGF